MQIVLLFIVFHARFNAGIQCCPPATAVNTVEQTTDPNNVHNLQLRFPISFCLSRTCDYHVISWISLLFMSFWAVLECSIVMLQTGCCANGRAAEIAATVSSSSR